MIRKCVVYSGLAAVAAWSAAAQIQPARAAASVTEQDPLHRQTPQSSVITFLEQCRTRNYAKAARYLTLISCRATSG